MLNQINLTDNTKNVSVDIDITNRLNCIANKSTAEKVEQLRQNYCHKMLTVILLT